MDPAATTTADSFVEDTYVKPQFGLIEFLRRIREDQLSALPPELFGRNMTYTRLLFLDDFFIIKPEYIEHVLLTNRVNYQKSQILRHLLGPLLGNGLLISEGEFWRRQRRIAAPAFHSRRIADFIACSWRIRKSTQKWMPESWCGSVLAPRRPFDQPPTVASWSPERPQIRWPLTARPSGIRLWGGLIIFTRRRGNCQSSSSQGTATSRCLCKR